MALVLVEIDAESAEHELERAAIVGEALSDAVRRDRAVVFRVEPWRFAIVLVGNGSREAFLIAQRLRLAVRHAGADASTCTASIGIALAPVNGAEASELIDAAEQAMHTTEAISRDASIAISRGRRAVEPTDVFRRVEALRTLKQLADENFHGGRAHSDAVAERAVRIAHAMHLEVAIVQAIQLASELSEIGSLLIRDGALHPSLPSGVLGLDSGRGDAVRAPAARLRVRGGGRDRRERRRALRRHGHAARLLGQRDPDRRAHPRRRARRREHARGPAARRERARDRVRAPRAALEPRVRSLRRPGRHPRGAAPEPGRLPLPE